MSGREAPDTDRKLTSDEPAAYPRTMPAVATHTDRASDVEVEDALRAAVAPVSSWASQVLAKRLAGGPGWERGRVEDGEDGEDGRAGCGVGGKMSSPRTLDAVK